MTLAQTHADTTHAPDYPDAARADALDASPVLLPLESGDHLSRAEFHRRYEAMPDLKKAELIEGVVYVGSPVRVNAHGKPHAAVLGWIMIYVAATPHVEAADNTTVLLDGDNEVQPDVLLRMQEETGGQSRIVDDYVEGPPELVVEVAASSASIDRHDKLRVYRRNGVREYLLWRVHDREIEWLVLRDGNYVPLAADERGVLHSQVFPGLRLHVPALLEGDLATVVAEVQTGTSSPEHARFVQALAERRAGTSTP